MKLHTFKWMCRGAVLATLLYLVLVYHLEAVSERIPKVPGIIYLLQWTPPTTEPFAFMGKGIDTFVKRKCVVMNCYVTSNRHLLGDITDFDAVLFHGREIVYESEDATMEMPNKRNARQIYVFASMESSGYYPVSGDIYDDYFNLTWTYKLNSDIYYGYLSIRNRNGEIIGPSKEMHWIKQDQMLPVNDKIKKKLANKTIAAAWFVSNCRAPSKRIKLVEEIKREMDEFGLTVDVYGRCGDKRCPRSSMDECLKLLQRDYYFYFSFENSFSEDYVSEKLLHALKNYAVPVVYGGANYSRFMPKGAYLDAYELSPKELVKEMFDSISDPDRYVNFFKWHNHYSYHDIEESPDTDPYCKLCDYINTMVSTNKSNLIHDFQNWWNPQIGKWINLYSKK